MTNQIARYANRDAWVAEGETLAYAAAHLPYRIGEWYDDGVQQFGARAVIVALAENRAAFENGQQPEYPYLARVSLHTVQNYATTARAIRADDRLTAYDFFHVEAVLGVPDIGKRLELLETGKHEAMSVARFRHYRDEELGKLAPPPADSVARLNGKVIELTQANHEYADAVQSYAAQAREYAALEAAAAERLAANPLAGAEEAYQRDIGPEWMTSRPVCRHCGRPLVCAECGGVQG